MDSRGNFLNNGDLVEFDRGTFKHWGVYDNGWIIHVQGQVGDSESDEASLNNPVSGGSVQQVANGVKQVVTGNVKASVKREKLKDVANNDKIIRKTLWTRSVVHSEENSSYNGQNLGSVMIGILVC